MRLVNKATEGTDLVKTSELDAFVKSTDELIESKYIIADIKIVGVLKCIACSETMLALISNCLDGFDYQEAKRRYLVKSPYLSEEKGEFILPTSSRELIAFVFNILVDIDAKRIDLGSFINKYFYENGSTYAGYASFINMMIKPFVNTVKMLMENVLSGEIEDPIEALKNEEEKKIKQKLLDEKSAKTNKESSDKKAKESLKTLKALLLADKKKIKNSGMEENDKLDAILIIDTLANAAESKDKDAVSYALVGYKFMTKCYKFKFFGRYSKVQRYIKDIINEI